MARRLLTCGKAHGGVGGAVKFPPICGTGLSSTTSDSDSESDRQFIVRTSYILRDLFVQVSTNDLSNSCTVRSRVNGANGGMSVSVPPSTTGDFEDTVGFDNLSSGDLVNTQIVEGGASGSFGFRCNIISYSLEDETGNKSIFGATVDLSDSSSGDRYDPGITRYLPLNGRIRSGLDTEEDQQYRFRHSATLSNLRAVVNDNGVEASTITLRIDGAAGNQSLSIPANTTGAFEDTTNTDSIVSGDLVNYEVVVGAVSMHSGILKVTLVQVQVESEDGRITANALDSAGLGGFSIPLEGEGSGFANTDAVSPIDFGGRDYFLRVTDNTKDSDSESFFRINGSNTTFGVVIPSNTTGEFEDTDTTVDVASGDTVSHQTAAPGSGSITRSLQGFVQTEPIPFVPVPGRAFFFWY